MRVLITGSGSQAGSYPIRAQQLGEAIGATVEAKATNVDGFDALVLVKRRIPETIEACRRAGVPLILDLVDGWPQPNGNAWPRDICMAWLKAHVATIKPAAIVAATGVMEADCAALGVPVLALPHHARPGLRRNPIREKVLAVGYEGAERHLGKWLTWLQFECSRRGWTFHVNPPELADVDIVVALRELTGYAPRHWKSNVKLANAQASGTPIICNREAGYRETAAGVEYWADTEEEVSLALDALTSLEVRQATAEWLLASPPTLRAVAGTYLRWLETTFARAGVRSDN